MSDAYGDMKARVLEKMRRYGYYEPPSHEFKHGRLISYFRDDLLRERVAAKVATSILAACSATWMECHGDPVSALRAGYEAALDALDFG
jgi:hypothetical protein